MKVLAKAAALAGLLLALAGPARAGSAAELSELIAASGRSPDLDAVKAALKKVRVNKFDSSGMTALLAAAENGRTEIAAFLLDKGANINERRKPEKSDGKDGRTPLMLAIQFEHRPMVELLLERKARLDVISDNGDTALHWAAFKGSREIVELLLKRGAPPHAQSKAGGSALATGAAKGHLEIVKLIAAKVPPAALRRPDMDGFSALHSAALEGHLAVVEFLVEQGLPVEGAPWKDKWTPLMAACRGGNPEVVGFLVERGANINAVSTNGWTPLQAAVANDKLDVVRFLIAHKVDIHYVDAEGWNAVLLAGQKGHKAVLKELLLGGGRALRTSL